MKFLSDSLKRVLLRKTTFPSLDVESVPELAHLSCSEESSDEESVSRRREQYRTKEDEDVAVFLEISRRLSVKSTIFLLQNHARNMNIPEAALTAALERPTPKEDSQKPKPLQKIKKFRFAEVSEQHVRAVVHVIPRNDEDPESSWWTQEEAAGIRKEATQLVMFCRKHEHEFLKSVAVLAQPDAAPADVEQHMKAMMQNLGTRGLESHMASCLSSPRRKVVRAVLDEQARCRRNRASAEEICECLRKASLAESAQNLSFASRMGEYDQIEALKASLSRWRNPRRSIPST